MEHVAKQPTFACPVVANLEIDPIAGAILAIGRELVDVFRGDFLLDAVDHLSSPKRLRSDRPVAN
jgi:hypothetical protein